MRILKRALGTAAALFLVVGCTDVTTEPRALISEANVFDTPSAYPAFLARVYAGLGVTGQQGPAGNGDVQVSDEGFSQYLRQYWQLQELPTDEAIIGWNDADIHELNEQTWTAGNTFVKMMWSRVYFQIMMANEFLRQTDDARLAARGHNTGQLYADIQTYRAEARFLRALSYWHGLDLFGSRIPLVTEASVLGTVPGPSSGTQVFDFIASELLAIRADLPAPGAASSYARATTGAANMLLAKLYLNSEVYTSVAHYDSARIFAEAVISGPYSLTTQYRWNFMADNNTSPEIIFQIAQDGQRTQTWGGMTFLTHAACGGSMSDANYGIGGCWWGLRMKPEAYARFQAGDTARSSFFWTTGQTITFTDNSPGQRGDFTRGVPAPKYLNLTQGGSQGSSGLHPDTDFPMFRLADAYLIYAEATLRPGGGGNAATALGYVNALRQRSFGSTAGNYATLTLQDVLDERLRELLWEGHRRTDLIRFGQFTGNTYVWSFKNNAVPGAGTASTFNLYPIPQYEIFANPSLIQNPGY